MRPAIRFLEKELIEIILLEARAILCRLGIEIHNGEILALLGDHGADVDLKKNRVCMNKRIIDRALASSPHSFKLFDVNGALTHDFSGANVYFTPGSAALYLLDAETRSQRRPNTADYVRYAKLVSRLPHIASQSTALIPADVPEPISDSYRLYLSLLFCDKPVVTGTFTIESFALMKDLQLAVRGSEAALKEKPLTVFSCCPTSPLKWSDVTSQNVIDCGRYGIPVEFIAMPLSGFVAPVTLVGTLIQHTAETLSGIVISQLAHPGAPILYGGSPAVFDVRYETTPMGDIEHPDARLRLQRDRQAPRPAHPGLYLAERRQGARRPGRAGIGHGRHPGRPGGHQQHLRAGHAGLRELPEPGKIAPGQRNLRHDPAHAQRHHAQGGFPLLAPIRRTAARKTSADRRRIPGAI